MSNLVTVLKDELKQIEADLRKDPRYRRAQKIRDLLADYEPAGAEPSLFDREPAVSVPPVSRVRESLDEEPAGGGSKEIAVKAAVTKLLSERGPLHRQVILDDLVAKGLMGKEKRPIKSLASYLSKWRETFSSDGNGTFSLRH